MAQRNRRTVGILARVEILARTERERDKNRGKGRICAIFNLNQGSPGNIWQSQTLKGQLERVTYKQGYFQGQLEKATWKGY